LKEILDEEDFDLACNIFNVKEKGNFISEEKMTGTSILHLDETLDIQAKKLQIPEEKLRMHLENLRQKLFRKREKRIHPHKDDKILLDWNGLMIAALAKAGRVLKQDAYVNAAEKATRFVLENMQDKKGRLLHRYRNGSSGIEAQLDDYVFFTWGLLELYEAIFKEEYLAFACSITDDLINRFWDEQFGGFYFTSKDAHELLVRQKDIYDGALPSGNSVALFNLVRLSMLTFDYRYLEKASELGACFSEDIMRAPSGSSFFLAAYDLALGPSYEIIVSGKRRAGDTEEMLLTLASEYLPHVTILFHPENGEKSHIRSISEFTKNLPPFGGAAAAYICQSGACTLPATRTEEILKTLDASRKL
jgi:uncharacterized protein YyaL (SSP411 family)